MSRDGGREPAWGKGGREIYFRNGDAMMMVPVSPNGSSLVLGKPEPLFTGRFVTATNPSGDRWYDVTPDGQRFLMLKARRTASVDPGPELPRRAEVAHRYFAAITAPGLQNAGRRCACAVWLLVRCSVNHETV
jgi:hypothetical protein